MFFLALHPLLGLDATNAEWQVEITTDSLEALHTIQLVISEQSFLDFPLLYFNNWQCWLSLIQHDSSLAEHIGFALEDLDTVLGDVTLNIRCIQCPVTNFDTVTARISSAGGNLADLNDLLQHFNARLEGSTPSIRLLTSRVLEEASQKCPLYGNNTTEAAPMPDDRLSSASSELRASSSSLPLVSWMFLVTCVGLVLVYVVAPTWLYVLAPWNFIRKYRKWLRSLDREALRSMFKEQMDAEEEDSAARFLGSGSLWQCPRLSVVTKCMLPLAQVAAIPMCVAGSFWQSVLYRVYLDVAGSHVIAFDVRLSLWEVSVTFWHGGGRVIAVCGCFETDFPPHSSFLLQILTVLLVIVLPVVRNLVTLGMWFIPQQKLSSRRRYQLINTFSLLGKLPMLGRITINCKI